MAKKNASAATATAAANGDIKATKCPVNRKQFSDHAKPLLIRIGETAVVAGVKQFSTGGFGWSINEKIIVDIGGVPCKAQLGLNLSIVGSKHLAS